MSAQGSIIRYVTAMVIVGLAVLTATTFYNSWKEIGQVVPADARASAYFEQYSKPDCRFEGTWHDWERDEWMTLGCLKVKNEHREGSYSSAMGPRGLPVCTSLPAALQMVMLQAPHVALAEQGSLGS